MLAWVSLAVANPPPPVSSPHAGITASWTLSHPAQSFAELDADVEGGEQALDWEAQVRARRGCEISAYVVPLGGTEQVGAHRVWAIPLDAVSVSGGVEFTEVIVTLQAVDPAGVVARSLQMEPLYVGAFGPTGREVLTASERRMLPYGGARLTPLEREALARARPGGRAVRSVSKVHYGCPASLDELAIDSDGADTGEALQ